MMLSRILFGVDTVIERIAEDMKEQTMFAETRLFQRTYFSNVIHDCIEIARRIERRVR